MSIGTEATWICPTIADSLLIFLVMTIPVGKPGRHEKHLEHLFTTVYMIHPQPPWYRQIPGPLQDRILVSPTMADSLLICLVMTIHVRKQGRHELDGHVYPYKEAWKATFDGHVQFITTGPCIPFFIQIAFKFPSSNNLLSIITNYNWQVAALTRCHEPPCYLVLATPLLSS